MNPSQIKAIMEEQGVQIDPAHAQATSSILLALLKSTAERFSSLPLEAEPSGFQAGQRRSAP